MNAGPIKLHKPVRALVRIADFPTEGCDAGSTEESRVESLAGIRSGDRQVKLGAPLHLGSPKLRIVSNCCRWQDGATAIRVRGQLPEVDPCARRARGAACHHQGSFSSARVPPHRSPTCCKSLRPPRPRWFSTRGIAAFSSPNQGESGHWRSFGITALSRRSSTVCSMLP